MKDSKTGKYYLFICAYSKTGTPFPYRGCIGLAVADRLEDPYELLPLVADSLTAAIEQWPFGEMERPQVIFQNGQYHLFFSCWPRYLNPHWRSQIDPKRITGSSLYHYVFDSIDGPFQPTSSTPIVPNSENTSMYGVNFFGNPNHAANAIVYGWYYRLFSLETSPLFRATWHEERLEMQRSK